MPLAGMKCPPKVRSSDRHSIQYYVVLHERLNEREYSARPKGRQLLGIGYPCVVFQRMYVLGSIQVSFDMSRATWTVEYSIRET